MRQSSAQVDIIVVILRCDGCEIALRPFTFCNLTEINAGEIKNQEDLNKFAEVGAFFGTLQAGFTDFHYLRNSWKVNTEKDALIGVGITGIANGTLSTLNLEQAVAITKIVNNKIAKIIGINSAARVTTIKPSGTTSCVVGTSSGIHAWHSRYYIRNMQCAVGDDLYNFFKKFHPELIKVMTYQPKDAVIGIPQKAPDNAILREDETALDSLARVKRYNLKWVRKGHNRGPNTNNVSATISCKKHEWKDVGEWMWSNRNDFNGLSVLPFDGGTYENAPFETCTKEFYLEKIKYIQEYPIDLRKIVEEEDNTDLTGELACSGGNCEII